MGVAWGDSAGTGGAKVAPGLCWGPRYRLPAGMPLSPSDLSTCAFIRSLGGASFCGGSGYSNSMEMEAVGGSFSGLKY